MTLRARQLYEQILPIAKDLEVEQFGELEPLRAACAAYSEALWRDRIDPVQRHATGG